jgi:hypothetical protein
MLNLTRRKADVHRPRPDYAHGTGRKRSRAGDVPRDAQGVVVGFTGIAATGEGAVRLEPRQSGRVVPVLAGHGKQHLPPDHGLGGQFLGEHDHVDGIADPTSSNVLEPDQGQGPAGIEGTGRTKPRSLTERLTWATAAERNRKLKPWRRAVLTVFADQPRCLRIAWVLADLFNAKSGYAYASNEYLADETHMAENKARATLGILEAGRAIIRTYVIYNGRKQRVIYPSSALLPRPTVGRVGVPQQPGHHNLSKTPRLPKTELERARRAHETAERRKAEKERNRPQDTVRRA